MFSKLGTLMVIIVLPMSLSACLYAPDPVEASMSISADPDVALAILEAEERVIICYHAVAEADNVGADATALLARLDEAGWHLSRARGAYELGDFDQASHYALLCQQKLEGLVTDAETLKQFASEQQFWDFMTNVVGSIAATLMVICGSCVAWILLKRRPEDL